MTRSKTTDIESHTTSSPGANAFFEALLKTSPEDDAIPRTNGHGTIRHDPSRDSRRNMTKA